MMRLQTPGAFHPGHLPMLVVCRDEQQTRSVRRQVADHPEIRVASAKGGASVFLGTAAAIIVVCEGVDLDRDIDGEGTLRHLLKRRQMVWGDRAVFVQL